MRYRWVWWVLGAVGLVIVGVPAAQLTVGAVWATDEHTAAATQECTDLAASAPVHHVSWQGGLFPHWTCEWWDAAASAGGSANIRWYEILR